MDVLRAAAAIARKLGLRPPVRDRSPVRGRGRFESVPYRYHSDDIDLDRTLDILAQRPVPDEDDIVVRERRRARRAVVLVVDVSGSMRGEKARIAAATVAALAAELVDDELGVVAFWKDAAVVRPLVTRRAAVRVVDDLLHLPARGLTNVTVGLAVAAEQLVQARALDRRAILLSDAVHNAGPDPRPAAMRLPRLDVLLETDGEHDRDLATDLARAGRGRLALVRTHLDVASGLQRLLRG